METVTTNSNPEKEKFKKKMLNPFFFWFFLMTQLPAGWIAGLRLRLLEGNKCTTSVPFKFLNKNPFKSIYFAVQSMAAELSTAALVLYGIEGVKPSIAFIIVNLESEFSKKANGRTYFTCEDGDKVTEAVERCLNTGESVTVRLKTVGRMKDGTEVSTFYFTWSMKQRNK